LPEYYWAENRELLDRFREGKNAFDRSPRAEFRAVTLVAGAAGVGKTFLKEVVFSKDYPRSAICKFDIREVYDEWASDGIIADKADLASGDLVINRLKSVTDKSKPRLRDYLEAKHASFYVIDSLDEIHPDDYGWVLEQVEDFVFRREHSFVHVVVFGRGFAFRDFWAKPAAHRRENNIELYVLNPPTFRTTGDLLVSSWNYHSWKFGLAWAPHGGEPEPMPLDAYAQWASSGFTREGKFKSVTCQENEDIRADVQNVFVHCACTSPLVCSALYNLAGNTLMREILCEQTLQRLPVDEGRIAEAYLDAWLVRGTKVHGRPSRERPEHLDLYLSLLERVAVKYLEGDALDDGGWFLLRDSDTVTVDDGRRQLTFPVNRILDRSGLIIADPRGQGVATHGFEPICFHRLLVERHSRRAAWEPRSSEDSNRFDHRR
jgi:hypothetical protein